MLKQACYFISLISMALVNIGALTAQPKPSIVIASKPSQQVRYFGKGANRIDINGRFNVALHTGYKKPKIILKGYPEDLQQVAVKIQPGLLTIAKPASGRLAQREISVEIRAHRLNVFKYRGGGVINGQQLYSDDLTLEIYNRGSTRLGGDIRLRKLVVGDHGNVQINGVNSKNLYLSLKDKARVALAGVVQLNYLNMSGQGFLSLYWVKSDRLNIRLREAAELQIAGIAKMLDVELWGHAKFHGRYLRAHRSFVKTHGRSLAEINTLARQHTLAADASDIYYYTIPELRQDFMAYQGSVLDMRDWNLPDLEEYTMYNKD